MVSLTRRRLRSRFRPHEALHLPHNGVLLEVLNEPSAAYLNTPTRQKEGQLRTVGDFSGGLEAREDGV